MQLSACVCVCVSLQRVSVWQQSISINIINECILFGNGEGEWGTGRGNGSGDTVQQEKVLKRTIPHSIPRNPKIEDRKATSEDRKKPRPPQDCQHDHQLAEVEAKEEAHIT